MRLRSLVLSLLLLTLALPLSANAAPEKHPLMVLKAIFNTGAASASQSVRGTCSVWVKNLSDVAVDGVKVTLKLREGSRTIRSLDKEVGRMEGGKKAYVDFKWDEYTNRNLKPQIWITYNGPGGAVTFEAEPPVW